ncbi:MAG: tRNA threonylcarbamoyladenosine dehydratase [Bacilli bacterium]|nr:tRNA threonylcarbamoyladenosine dehydratase [Bacilli bacterium]MDD3895479.1 tRNA threonylcarbamoyladenosine dehydratase [Bacilli bacterium]MDD4407432.1 tRNA threonylcarbamoyladenosine dehydratase [Bacilli bacterium]
MFERMISLIGKDKFSKLQTTNVLVVGIGGVGGYALEALARSGIINISIIDYDKIEITNLNRQIISSNDNIGLNKVDVAKERVLKINPDLKIAIFNENLTKDNIDSILKNKYDYVIDACDTIDTKVLIIEKSLKYKFKLISCMGTANKTNPALLSITELSKTNNDPIAKILRKKVKELKINKKISVVSSTETPIANKNLGTNSYIPGIAGLLCASYVINDITKK